tara:strand:+ start:80 stop:526 length:447 start_codon:yes stop_codon:yes gene_type:complete
MMFDMFSKLSNREKNLIIIASMALVMFTVFLVSKNIIDSYALSKQKLIKAKSDYEYVLSKVEILNQNIGYKDPSISSLNSFLKDINSDILYSSEVSIDKDKMKIKLLTNNLEDSLSISTEISNKFKLDIEKFNYSVIDEKAQTILLIK